MDLVARARGQATAATALVAAPGQLVVAAIGAELVDVPELVDAAGLTGEQLGAAGVRVISPAGAGHGWKSQG